MSLLNDIQQKLKVPKGQYNSFAKYYYRNAEDILEAVKPLLGKGTLHLDDEVVHIGDRYYVKATAWLTDGEKVWNACGWAREEQDKKGMDAAQITGAASSYARKYALNGLFCIDDTKDADSQEPQNQAKQPATASKPVKMDKEAAARIAGQKDRIKAALDKLGEKSDTLADVSEACVRLVNLELQSANFDRIGDALWKLAEEKN